MINMSLPRQLTSKKSKANKKLYFAEGLLQDLHPWQVEPGTIFLNDRLEAHLKQLEITEPSPLTTAATGISRILGGAGIQKRRG